MSKKKRVIKKKIVKREESKEPVYVQLHNPVEHRKLILRTAIETAKLIQDYEAVRAIKTEKTEVLKKFFKVVSEAKAIQKSLIGTVLPKLKEEPKPKVVEQHVEKVKSTFVKKTEIAKKVEAPKKVIEERKSLTDVEKLQQELSDIEGKLAKL